MAGNIPGMKTVKRLLSEQDVLGCSKVKMVMDRGASSGDNLTPPLHGGCCGQRETPVRLLRPAHHRDHGRSDRP